MPSSGPEDWDRLYEDLSRHERDRETLGYSKDLPLPDDRAAAARILDVPDIPRYQIMDRLGEGATAVVYRALDRQLHRPVALKVQRQSLAPNEIAGERFRREAQAAAGVSHPNVVMIHDAGENRGRLYLVMELIEGRPFSDVLKNDRPELPTLLRLLEKAARGVAAAHEKGIVHRDLKPSNILVPATGEPKVADFGLAHLVDSTAQLTKTGSSLGTPLYMSPEQVEGRVKDISPRTDVYSLGAILYELVTGQVPHDGQTMMEIYGRIVCDDPMPPRKLNAQAPVELETIALKALEKDPQRRYPTAREFADDLARYLAGEPVLARPIGATHRTYRALRKSPVARGVAVALSIAVVVAVAVGLATREKAGRLEAERDQRMSVLRELARTSFEAMLQLRRAGENQSMKQFVPRLEAAYRQALEAAPDVAEVEYLMGRMHRALMEEDKALGFQERALGKDPAYAPALYEQAVLLAVRYGSELTKAVADARRLPAGAVTAQTSRSIPLPDPQEVEVGRPELVAIRDTILKDCTAIEKMLSRTPEPGQPRPVGDANVLTVKGILAFCRLSFPEARRLLEEAVRKDPSLEEAWSALCETAYRQANIAARTSTDIPEVLRAYADADALYEKALSYDKGFAPHWVGRADNRRHRGFFLMARGQDGGPDLKGSDEELGQAVTFNPNAPDTWFLRASVRQMLAVLRMDRSQDPSKELEAAEEVVNTILSRWGDRSVAWSLKGQLHFQRARWRTRSGGDPMPEYEASEQGYDKAIQLDPRAIEAVLDRGTTRLSRALSKSGRNMDPLPDFAGAERDFSDAIAAARHTTRPWEGRGQVLYYRGAYRQSRNQDPSEEFVKAIADFDEAIRIYPSNARMTGLRGKARAKLAALLEKKGETAEAVKVLTQAAADFARAIELNRTVEGDFAGDATDVRQRLARLVPK